MSDFNRIAILGDLAPKNLKQIMLLFDRVSIYKLDELIIRAPTSTLYPREQPHVEADIRAEMEDLNNSVRFLTSQNLLYDAGDPVDLYKGKKGLEYMVEDVDVVRKIIDSHKSMRTLVKGLSQASKDRELPAQRWFETPKSKEILRKIIDAHAVEQSLTSRLIAKKMRIVDGVDAVHVSSHANENIDNPEIKQLSNVVKVVLKNVPLPSDQTSWEDILSFKNDSEVRGHLRGLRTWMTDMSKTTLSAPEINDKLEWHLFQQQKHLKASGLEHGAQTIGSLFVATAELLENLAKIKWGKLAQNAISMSQGQARLLQSELAGPASEVSFFLRAKSKFGVKN